MRDKDDLRSSVDQVADGGQGRPDPHVVRDVLLLVHGDVKIDPDKNLLPFQLSVFQIRNAFFHILAPPIDTTGQERFFFPKPFLPFSPSQKLLATSFTRSIIRQEKPHSLSYQERTLIRLPSMTMVDLPSTMEECGLPR